MFEAIEGAKRSEEITLDAWSNRGAGQKLLDRATSLVRTQL